MDIFCNSELSSEGLQQDHGEGGEGEGAVCTHTIVL